MKLTRSNFDRIRQRFSAETGVLFSDSKCTLCSWRTVVVLVVALVCCLGITAFSVTQFSGLSGDDLALSSVYEGNGVVQITVENRSDKTLRFQKDLKLMRWQTGTEISAHGDVLFEHTTVAPKTTGTMTVDLSEAYDISALEQPISDHYYFVLTNNHFAFGQDWMCSVNFADSLEKVPATEAVYVPNPTASEAMFSSYFASVIPDPAERRTQTEKYESDVSAFLSGMEIVAPVTPPISVAGPENGIIWDAAVPADMQDHLITSYASSLDNDWKLIGRKLGEQALVVHVSLPLLSYEDATTSMPLLYLVTYEKSAVTDSIHVFLHGRLMTFEELEPYRVYEDDRYVCYEIHELIYGDVNTWLAEFAARNPDVLLDDATNGRVDAIVRYYATALGARISVK